MSTSSAKVKQPTQIITSTAIGAIVIPAMLCKQKVTIPANTTLNEAHKVMAAESIGPKNGSDFVVGYFGIGIKGFTPGQPDDNGISIPNPNQHAPNDFNAFFPIPHLVRRRDADLSSSERDNFRIRVPFEKDGVQYVGYWLRKLKFDEFKPVMRLITRDELTGATSPVDYIPKDEDLHPTPQVIPSDGVVPVTNQYMKGDAKVNMSFTGVDLDEVKNACQIMYGNASYAAISEYYVVAGIEATNQGPIGSGSGSVSYNELKSAVITHHITEAYARDANSNGNIPLYFNIGSSSPMLVYGPRTASASSERI